MHKATFPELVSLHSVRLISGLKYLEKSKADSYHSPGVTQHAEDSFPHRALDVVALKRFIHEHLHVSTAERYHSLDDTQYAQGDFPQVFALSSIYFI